MNAPATINKPLAEFNRFMERFKPQLALALPKHLNPDRMARLALTAFSTSQKLQDCDPNSIAASLMTAGQLGLEPGVNGAGWLIPYKRKCTFVPGWKGLVDLVARSGRGTVYTGVIFKDQEYEFTDGAKRDLKVLNETELDDPADITHAYAIGWVRDASMPIIELWTIGKIRKHRDKYNKVGADHYSYRDWEMYCRKVPLLQVLKYMPASVELSNAIDVTNAAENGRGVTIEGGIVIDMEGGNPETDAVETYPQADFEKSLPSWRKAIAEGKRTADQVIATAESKHPLTDEQKAAIRAPATTEKSASNEPATADRIAEIEQKAEAAALSTADVCKAIDADMLKGITNAQADKALSFIADPVGA